MDVPASPTTALSCISVIYRDPNREMPEIAAAKHVEGSLDSIFKHHRLGNRLHRCARQISQVKICDGGASASRCCATRPAVVPLSGVVRGDCGDFEIGAAGP